MKMGPREVCQLAKRGAKEEPTSKEASESVTIGERSRRRRGEEQERREGRAQEGHKRCRVVT